VLGEAPARPAPGSANEAVLEEVRGLKCERSRRSLQFDHQHFHFWSIRSNQFSSRLFPRKSRPSLHLLVQSRGENASALI
jgi:hypothetical protein